MVHLSYTAVILLVVIIAVPAMGIGGVLMCVREEIHHGHHADEERTSERAL